MLRHEARPFEWTRLFEDQKRALQRLLDLLDAAVSDLDRGGHRREVHASAIVLDPARSSRLAFVTGNRGTGKSSVLLSLLDAFAGESSLDLLDEPVRETVERLRRRIVWLDWLDMEPLPRSTNLLASILTRVERAAERFSGWSAGEDEGNGCAPLSPRASAALQKLTDLQRDVSRAWDGNIQQRAAGLDADEYAAEVMDAERARLDLNQRLHECLENLAEHVFCTAQTQDPIFVLPVDDFDLNPGRCLELLRLLRMISVPRLFIALAGDLEIAEMIVQLRLAGDVADIELGALRSGLRTCSPEELGWRFGKLAIESLRKLVPPGQRIELEALRPKEAIAYRPTEDALTLRDKLSYAQIEFAITSKKGQVAGTRIERLSDLLTASVFGTDDSSPYAGNEILRAPARNIADLWHALPPDASGAFLPDQLTNFVARRTREAIRADSNLSPEDRKTASEAVTRLLFGSWSLLADRFKSVWLLSGGLSRDVEVPGLPASLVRLDARYASGWQMKLRRPGGDPASRAREEAFAGLYDPALPVLSGSPCAWILLFNDILAVREESDVIGGVLTPNVHTFLCAATTWMIPPVPPALPWYTPTWPTFWEYDQFMVAWKSALQRISGRGKAMREGGAILALAFAWISACSALLGAQKPIIAANEQPSSDEWKRLAELQAGLNPSDRQDRGSRRSDDLCRYWLGALALNLSPERAIPADVASLFAEELGDYWSGSGIAGALRNWRAEDLAKIWAMRQDLAHRLGVGVVTQRQLVDGVAQLERATGAEVRDSVGSTWGHFSNSVGELLTHKEGEWSKETAEGAIVGLVNLTAEPRFSSEMSRNHVLLVAHHTLADWLERLASDHEWEARKHPLNALAGGILRPSEEDIQRAIERTRTVETPDKRQIGVPRGADSTVTGEES